MKFNTVIAAVFFAANCHASDFYTQQVECGIDVSKNSNIDFFTDSDFALSGGSKGTFTITAGSEIVKVFVTPISQDQDEQLNLGINYIWTVDGNQLDKLNELYTLGDVSAGNIHEFSVYPKTLVDLMPAGQRSANINLYVECIPHSRLPEKYKRIVGFEMIRG